MKFTLGFAVAMLAGLLSVSAQAQVVRVGVAAEPYPPFTEPDASGQWKGWEVDFMNAICAEAKLKCEITPVAWDGIIPALTSNKIDAIISSMSITEERMKTIDFSDKYYNTPSSIVAAKGAKITPDAKGLAGKVIGVQVETIHRDYVLKHFKDVKEVKEYQTQDEANADLAAGRVDAIMADSLTLDAFLQTDQGKKCCAMMGNVADDPSVLGLGVGIGLRKGDPNKAKFNAAIAAVRKNGTYDAITKKYFPFDIYGK